MKFLKTVFLLALAFSASSNFAHGQMFSDGFESYTTGAMPGGTWNDFGGTQPIVVSTTQARSGTKSMRLSEGTQVGNAGYGSDVWSNLGLAGVLTTGQYEFSYWQFIESAVDSVAFNYISSGIMPATFQTGLDLRADPINGSGVGIGMLVVQDVAGTPTLRATPAALVLGAWVEHKVNFNLNSNLYSYSYNGTNLVNNLQFDTTPGDGVSFGGINFWMQLGNANAINNFVYYDDFKLIAVPEPTTAGFLMLGLCGTALLRRKNR